MRILLNLGCGQTRPDNWVNVDISLNSLIQRMTFIRKILARHTQRTIYASANCIYMDLKRRWSIASDSVDVLYASHIFEHLKLPAADLFMKEARRVLKINGAIRIVVPDLYRLAKDYVSSYENGKEDAHRDFLYALNLHQQNTYSAGRSPMIKLLNWIQDFPHQHKYMYDARALKKIMLNFGFSDIVESSYGISRYIPEIAEVEGTKEVITSIYIEGRKVRTSKETE